MARMAQLIEEAKSNLDAGNDAYKAQNYQAALQSYLISGEKFKLASKNVPNWEKKEKEEMQKSLQGKVDLAIGLADKCMKLLKEKKEGGKQSPPSSPSGGKPSTSSGGDSGGRPSGKKDGGKDGEKDKIAENAESAIVREKPNVKWSEVAGLERAKEALQEAVVLPLRFPQLFTGKRKPWKGILMYGPPGTGKSYIAKAVATECDSTFFAVSSADIMSKWVGESEKQVRSLFTLARQEKPSVIFIDEVDSLCGARGSGDNDSSSRVKTEFLVQMQGAGGDDRGLLVLAATNLPQSLDSAIRRRFEYRIEIPLPDKHARAAMFGIHMGSCSNTLSSRDIDELAQQAEGYSGSDISVLVRDALYAPLRRAQTATHFKMVRDPENPNTRRLQPCDPMDPDPTKIAGRMIDMPDEQAALILPEPISLADFKKAFLSARPSVSKKDLQEIQKFTDEYGVSAQDKESNAERHRRPTGPSKETQTVVMGVTSPLS